MINKQLTSVILPTYNRAHLLHRADESVLAQTFSDWELIIWDDGSANNLNDF
jgi:glycosyltransferase involved in cell wall biosynthesis